MTYSKEKHRLAQQKYRQKPEVRAYERLYARAYRLRKKGYTVKLVKGRLQISLEPLNIAVEKRF